MTPLVLALISLAGVLGFVRLWSLRHSRRALLTLAVPAALLPLAAATVAGAWDFRADWQRIGETGTGGLATAIGYSRDWIEALIAGSVIGVAMLAVAIVLASRRRVPAERDDAHERNRASFAIAAIAIVAIAALPIVLARSERAAVGPLVQLVPIANLSHTDLGYPEIVSMPTRDMLMQLERDLSVAMTGGTVLFAVLGGCLLLGGRLRSSVDGAMLTRAMAVVVIAAIGAGIWYGLHAQSVTRLLDGAAGL